MEGSIHVWMNVAVVMSLIGVLVWMTVLPYTTFFEDDD